MATGGKSAELPGQTWFQLLVDRRLPLVPDLLFQQGRHAVVPFHQLAWVFDDQTGGIRFHLDLALDRRLPEQPGHRGFPAFQPVPDQGNLGVLRHRLGLVSQVAFHGDPGEQVRVDLRARLYQSGAERPFLLLLAVRSPCLAAGGAGDAKKGKEEGDDGAHGKSIAFLSFACLACPSWWFAVVWRLVNLPGPALTRGENLPIFMRKESMP